MTRNLAATSPLGDIREINRNPARNGRGQNAGQIEESQRRSDFLARLTRQWQRASAARPCAFHTAARQKDVKTTHAANCFARKRASAAYHP